jgi:hypothetical protein
MHPESGDGQATEHLTLHWHGRAERFRHSGCQTKCFQMLLSRSLTAGREVARENHIVRKIATFRLIGTLRYTKQLQ